MTLRPLTNTISSTWSPLMKVYRDAFVHNDIYAAAATSVVSPWSRWSCRSASCASSSRAPSGRRP